MTLHYVPAGVEAYPNSNAQISVKYGPNKKEESEFGLRYKQWRTKDRTISLVTKSQVSGVNIKHAADVVVPLFNASFVKACGLTKVLANPIHGDYSKDAFEALGIESIMDSGGFQLISGTSSFVHPDDVIANYNKGANIGIPLDLPIRLSVEEAFFHPVSKLIKANDDYILERLNKNVSLALISHGSNLELRKRRLDVLDRDADVVAIAGLQGKKGQPGVNKTLANAEALMYVVHRYRKTTKYFHVLGVTSKLWFFIYALLDAANYVKNIGGDSVSHRLSALIGTYNMPDFQTMDLSSNAAYRQGLPCNCPVCSVVDDTRIVQAQILLESHNLWVCAKQTEFLSSLAYSYLAGKTLVKTVYDALGLRTGISEFQFILNYVQEIMASDKFRPIKKEKLTGTLFSGIRSSAVTKGPVFDTYVKILKRYEKFHKKKFL